MKIDIYTSTINGEKYLSVPKGTVVSKLELTQPIDKDVQTLSPFRTRLEINPEKPHTALDVKDIAAQIETKGYAIHGAKTVIKVGET